MNRFIFALLLCVSSQAASISTITCSGGQATVNVSNTFAASQGVEITGNSVSSYNINATIVAATSSSFTFNVTCNGTGTGGAAAPAQQILVLSITNASGGYNVSVLFWNTTANPVTNPGFNSAWPGVTAAQTAALRAGTTVESTYSTFVGNTESTADMQANLLAVYATAQNNVATGLGQFAGFCWNGTAWGNACS
jgi:hypothetical protein